MNGIQVVVVIMAAVAALCLYLSHQQIILKTRIHQLLSPDGFCTAVNRCVVTENFAAKNMDECIRLLKEGRQCLSDKSSDPLQCYSVLVEGEKCLRETIDAMQPPPPPAPAPVQQQQQEVMPILDLTGLTLESDPMIIEASYMQ